MPMTIDGNGSITGLVAGGLPDATIVQADLASGVAGTGPAFSAYQSSAQTALAGSTFTKIQYQTEEFDTNNNFDTSTSRFTPTVAGYYQISAAFAIPLNARASIISIYKNGSEYKRGNVSTSDVGGVNAGSIVSALVYFNGSTDYVEIYAYQNSGTTATMSTGLAINWVTGALVRTA